MRTSKEFNKQDNIILTEIERRLRFFKKDLKENQLILLSPSEAVRLKQKGYIKPYNSEIPRCSNWYNLNTKGIELFSKISRIKHSISEKVNLKIFNGLYIFDYNKFID